MSPENKVRNFYDGEVIREWERMDRHPLEFGVTLRYMDKYYPKNASILDVGGGPGRYAMMLAQKGFNVTLVDISPKNVEFAKNNAKENNVYIKAICADALELDSYVKEQFDIVQCMGPLYHLLDEADRINCVQKCLHRLKPGGLFLASFISSYAMLADIIIKYPQEIVRYKNYFKNINKDSRNIENSDNPGFTDAFFVYPLNIEPFMKKFGLQKLAVAGVEGLANLNEPNIRELPEDIINDWIDISYYMSQDKLTWGANQLFIYIGRKDG